MVGFGVGRFLLRLARRERGLDNLFARGASALLQPLLVASELMFQLLHDGVYSGAELVRGLVVVEFLPVSVHQHGDMMLSPHQLVGHFQRQDFVEKAGEFVQFASHIRFLRLAQLLVWAAKGHIDDFNLFASGFAHGLPLR
jgi:hypothetical protein